MSEIQHRHNEMLLKIQETSQRNQELELKQVGINERIVSVARSINQLEKKDGQH